MSQRSWACHLVALGAALSMGAIAPAAMAQDGSLAVRPISVATPSDELVFTSMRDGNLQIIRIGADGGAESRLTQTLSAEFQPTWSRNGRIAWVSYRSGDGDIYTMNADGSDVRRLSARPGLEQSPAWSPDGRRLAYVGERDGLGAVFVVNADGSGERVVSGTLTEVGSPQWSPDGTKIAFGAAIENKPRIVVADLGAGHVGAVTNGTGGEFGPIWSPDGKAIVYVQSGGRTDGVNLRAIRLGERESVPLTKNGYTNSQPQFSPDGTKILYLSNASSQGAYMNVHVMNADGTVATNLTRWGHADLSATWSADARQVYFMSFRDWPGQIYRINSDGTDVRRLTHSKTQDGYPVVRPTQGSLPAVAQNR